VGRGFVARDSDPPLIAVMSLAPGNFASLAIRVALRGAAIADPCARDKPLVRGTADRTKGAAEEDRHGVEGRTLSMCMPVKMVDFVHLMPGNPHDPKNLFRTD
jgi:hypothetical protein